MGGLFEGLPLLGQGVIEQWRRRAAYTEELQRATIEKRWKLFPWWYFAERLRARDATAWRYDVLVQSTYAVVGVLAALNRLYFSSFEFKRAGRFISRLDVAPANLAPRLESLFDADERRATAELGEERRPQVHPRPRLLELRGELQEHRLAEGGADELEAER
jgi:hypothetical protein